MEFVNEPNLLEMSGCPKGYTPELYAKNQDIFARWLRENYPDCLFVGTSTSEGTSNSDPAYESAGDSNSFLKNVPLEVLLKGMQEKLDVYSYHYYNGRSRAAESHDAQFLLAAGPGHQRGLSGRCPKHDPVPHREAGHLLPRR